MQYLDDARHVIIIVGIPAVGKTTVVKKVVDMLKKQKKNVKVVSFGTEMLKYLKKNDGHRDQLRKMSRSEQTKIQRQTAKLISRIRSKILIIDTHAFISTPSGYYPGLPSPILDIIRPTHFISLTAKPERIYMRREKDKSRNRDVNSISAIKRELSIQDAMISACVVHSGAPVLAVLNKDGKVDVSARKILKTMGL